MSEARCPFPDAALEVLAYSVKHKAPERTPYTTVRTFSGKVPLRLSNCSGNKLLNASSLFLRELILFGAAEGNVVFGFQAWYERV